jgi:hypothetical protein
MVFHKIEPKQEVVLSWKKFLQKQMILIIIKF